MGFEATPGVTSRVIVLPKPRDGGRKTETIFTFDLSKMTLATALADPTASQTTMSAWTVDQLFRVMLEPADAPQHSSEVVHKDEVEELRSAFMRRFVWAIQANPLNDEAVKFAAERDPKSGGIAAFSSTYAPPGKPERPTLLHISAEATLLHTSAGRLFGTKTEVRDDLFRQRPPSIAFINYLAAFRRKHLKPLQALIAKNNADVRKVLGAMAYVQQISVALKFAEDACQMDRSVLWRDFFEHWDPPSGVFSPPRAYWEKLLWHDEELFESPLNGPQIAKLRDLQRKRIDPLIQELGVTAAWAKGGSSQGGGAECPSAKERDEDAKRRIQFLRTDEVILDALERWDDLGVVEQFFLSNLFDEMMSALAQCPGAVASLLSAEFGALARGASAALSAVPFLPRESSRQKLMADAISQFDPSSAFGPLHRTPLTEVITKSFKKLEKTRKLPGPIVSMWAHATPALLARFDKATPGKVNPEGTAWLFRSVFGMGVLSADEMNELFSDLDDAVASAVKSGVGSSKRRFKRIFKKELSDGKYAVRSNWWSDGRVFNSIKLAVGLLGIRQAAISALDEKTLSYDSFVQLCDGILRTTGAVHGLKPVLKTIFGAGSSALHHPPSILDKVSIGAILSTVTAFVSVGVAHQALGKTEDATYARQLAEADFAVAWLSLSIAVFEGVLGTTLPVAGLALIILRWGLFHQGLWDFIGGVESATPMVKVVRGILDTLEDKGGDMGSFLRTAPNWPQVNGAIERIRNDAPEAVDANDVADFPLFFHLETDHGAPLRSYAGPAYGLASDILDLLVED